MPETEWVRVKDSTTKHEYTVAKEAVREGETVLDNKDATDDFGTPLPGKPHLARGQRSGATQKEEN